MRQKFVVDLYYPWTEVDPYQVWFNRTSFPLSKSEPERVYYTVDAGKETPSPYCLKRDGYKVYNQCSIDYAKDFLEYDIHYLDPRYGFILKGSAYFEGTQTVKTDLFVDGENFGSIQIAPNTLKIFNVTIPARLYEKDSRVEVVLKNVQGEFVPIADLTVYQFEPEVKDEGGIQTASILNVKDREIVSVTPNPTKTNVKIQFSDKIGTPKLLKIFDASGRLVKSFSQLSSDMANRLSVKWDCRDEGGRSVSPGVYLIRTEIGDQVFTKKLVIMK